MEAVFIILSFSFIVAWLALGVSATWAANSIFFQFRKKYPEETQQQIPLAFTGMRHPKKVLYFLSSKSKVFLEERNDTEILKKRMFLIKSLYGWLSLHFGAMLVGLVIMLISKLIK
jgi:hypothetical protein